VARRRKLATVRRLLQFSMLSSEVIIFCEAVGALSHLVAKLLATEPRILRLDHRIRAKNGLRYRANYNWSTSEYAL
jgi:hypothetical protein